MTAPTPTRWRVYVALRDGSSHSEAADLLEIARPTVEHHARALVRAGALLRVDGRPGHPAKYRRGARSPVYEAQNLDRPGRTGPGDDARCHRGEWKVRVRPWGARRQEPPAEKEWEANGVRFREWPHAVADGRTVRVRESQGAHNCTLLIQPPEQHTNGAAERAALDREWARLVDLALDELEAVYGYERASAPEQVSPIETAWKAPALARGVRVQGRNGGVWTDGSKGTELETDTRRIAVAVADLPDHLDRDAAEKRDLLSRLDALQARADSLGAGPALAADLNLTERLIRLAETHQDRLEGLLGVQE